MNERLDEPAEETLTYAGTGNIGGGVQHLDQSARQIVLAALRDQTGEALVDWIRGDQANRWRRQERVPIEDYLSLAPVAAADIATRADLVYSEFILRESLGESASFADFIHRFPDLEAELKRLHTADQALGFGPNEAQPQLPAEPAFIGKYQLLEKLAEGGQGVVYRALHPGLGKEVVLKWSKSTGWAGAERDRLQTEGRILAKFDHPHIARVFDVDFHEDRPYLVMESVPGRNLQQYTEQSPPTPRRAAELVASIARALDLVHRHGVLHLDIKPKNVLVDPAGVPKLIDFGLAEHRDGLAEPPTGEGGVSGTLAYIAPEQARGARAEIGPRSDVFGLGGLLYFLLTGKAPYHGLDFQGAYARAIQGNWDRELLEKTPMPTRLREICRKALATDPNQRYSSAAELAKELEAFVRRPQVIRHVALVTGLLVVLGLVTWLAWPPPAAPAGTQLELQVMRGEVLTRIGEELYSGDKLIFRVRVPAGVHASLFNLDSKGQWFLADKRERSATDAEWEINDNMLDDNPGSELFVLCMRRSGPIELDTLKKWIGDVGSLATVPRPVHLTFNERGVRQWIGQKSDEKERGIHRVKPHEDPATPIRKQLEQLQERLNDRCDLFAGICFRHK
jgi:tRNA A-37 threonylcarbamoyl transferase component Bud32